ncbi:MAG: type VI secretion system tube protein Hcp [Verrucomicrobia bacterium]|nr:type VI secretion system tube protein Hcp [Verrucomicrobiota bacterium]MDA1065391.1 type VI secretion system tube protein Hcp [Verrucomicrobiota bacterium]
MKLNRISLLIPLLIIAPLLANGAIYIKFDGVDGESRDKDHKGWINLTSLSTGSGEHNGWSDLQSFSQGLSSSNSGKGEAASGQATGRRDAASGLATGRRDAASGQATGRRDAASGQATGRRDAASGQATGKRDAASGMATGKRQHKPLNISKPIDKATPILAKALASGNSIGNVTLQQVENGKTETMVLQNATVAAISSNGQSETVTLNYDKVQVRGWNPQSKE